MCVVVEHQGEPYCLLIDCVGEVRKLPADRFERNPATLDPTWRDVSEGIYCLDGELLVVLGVERLLDFAAKRAA